MSIFEPRDGYDDVVAQVLAEPIDPAVFPATIVTGGGAGDAESLSVEYGRGGLRLRDYFAANIVCGLMAGEAAATAQTRYTADRLAERAYQLADAMIAARARRRKAVPGAD